MRKKDEGVNGMADKNCQVCGGPVENGRCKLCGMPNKRDEVLYHLNENREEHYKHATPKAREILNSRELPLSDLKKVQQAKASAQKTKTAPRKEKPTKTAQPEIKINKKPVKKEKKKSQGMKIIVTLLLVGVAFAVADRSLFESSHKTVNIGNGIALEIYEISPDNSLVVGEDLPAGTYTAVLEEGMATLSLKYGMETEQWNFKDGQREMELTVSDGVLISLYNTDLADRTLTLQRYILEE